VQNSTQTRVSFVRSLYMTLYTENGKYFIKVIFIFVITTHFYFYRYFIFGCWSYITQLRVVPYTYFFVSSILPFIKFGISKHVHKTKINFIHDSYLKLESFNNDVVVRDVLNKKSKYLDLTVKYTDDTCT
jgi:hypothetical protein